MNLTGIVVGIYGLIEVISKIFGDNNEVKLAFIDFWIKEKQNGWIVLGDINNRIGYT